MKKLGDSGFYFTPPAVLSVEGVRGTAKELYREAVRRGFNGALTTFETRLHNGPLTWTRLTAPVDRGPGAQALVNGHQAYLDRNQRQVSDAVTAIDARKRQLAQEAGHGEEE